MGPKPPMRNRQFMDCCTCHRKSIAAEEAEKGMAEMSQVYEDTGRELYMGAGGREHD